ncbi:hypothetical protein SDC9_191633 [bioreactor metagenome]|uniref:Uncharacterized protein n=1 Tax=bioreactor metagenome TaxID=1076179 RepID=A0A645I009_9ZZZZ
MPATANIATAIAPAISSGVILSSSPRLISAEIDKALMPIRINSTMVAKPLMTGYFQMPLFSQSESSQALSHMVPPGSLTASPQCSGPFISTPSITACPPTGILLGTAIKADMIIRCNTTNIFIQTTSSPCFRMVRCRNVPLCKHLQQHMKVRPDRIFPERHPLPVSAFFGQAPLSPTEPSCRASG